METKVIVVTVFLAVIIAAVVAVIYEKNALLKNYPPGGGKKITIKSPYSDAFPDKPTAYKFFRLLREWEENKVINKLGQYESDKYAEYEVWEE